MTPPDAPDGPVGRMIADHGPALRAYLRRGAGDRDLADDLLHEVVVRVLRTFHTYEPSGRERAWLFAIAHNVLVDALRDRARHAVAGAAYEPVAPARQDVQSALDQALGRLPDEDRQIFLLAELGGLRYDEIADLRHLTHAAVRSRVFRARLALRDALAPPARLGPALIRRTAHD